ncbi:hypothetical protein ACJX0J_033072, partial [Zea mays]
KVLMLLPHELFVGPSHAHIAPANMKINLQLIYFSVWFYIYINVKLKYYLPIVTPHLVYVVSETEAINIDINLLIGTCHWRKNQLNIHEEGLCLLSVHFLSLHAA